MKYPIVTSQELIWTILLRRHRVVHLQEQPTNNQVQWCIQLGSISSTPLFCLAVERGRAAYTSCNSSLVAICVNHPKSIFISPHKALLAMHHMQATKYFLGTSLRVKKLTLTCYSYQSTLSRIWWTSIPISFSNGTSKISSLTSITTYLANFSVTQTRGSLYVTWQDIASKSLYYQQRLTHYSWTSLVIISGWEAIKSLGS